MNACSRIALRIGAGLSLLVAILAFGARVAFGQDTTAVQHLSLGDAVRLAARNSALAEGARYGVDAARARVTQARSALLPDLSANAVQAGRSFNTATFGFSLPGLPPNGEVIGPVKTLDVRGQARMDLLDFSSIERVRGAQAAVKASSADAANAAEQAAAAGAAAYLRVINAQAQVEARVADSSLANDLLSIARDQLRAGVGVALDVTRAEAQVSQVHAQLIAARNTRDRASLDLLRALGFPLSTRLVLTDSLAGLAMLDTLPAEQTAIDEALRNRPDLRAADAQLAAAERTIASIRAERLPTLSAFGDDGAIGINPQHLLNTYDWGIQVSVPLFDGFRREGRVQEQEAQIRQLEVKRRDLRQQVAVEVRGALLDVTSAREQVDAARERLRLAEQELSQARERFRAGVAGNADVITAELALNQSRDLLIGALTGYQSARVSLARSLGSISTLP